MKKLVVMVFLFLLIPREVYARDFYTLDIGLTRPVKNFYSVKLSSKDGFILKNGKGRIIGAIWEPEVTVRFADESFRIFLPSGEAAWESMNSLMLMHPDGEFTPIFVEGKGYRGNIFFRLHEGKPIIINRIILDFYLMGVVPSEIGDTAPKEALKAQAVASRSFALANREKFIKKGYNLDDTTMSQAYFGIEKETDDATSAVKETSGKILKFNGELCNSIFFSVSSGYTESSDGVWGGKKIEYLSSVKDPYSASSKNFFWNIKISRDEIERLLREAGKDIGKLRSFSLVLNNETGSVKNVRLNGSERSIELTGNAFRLILGAQGFKSSWFRVGESGLRFESGSEVIFKGKGYGHGVGMPQAGAVEMANQGFSFEEILQFYYKGAVVENGWR